MTSVFLKTFSLENKCFGVVKNEKDFLFFENLGKLSWIMGLEIIWNIHRKSLRQKGQIYLPVQEVSLGCGRWPKKSELATKRGSMEVITLSTMSDRTSPSSTSISGTMMSLQAIVVGSISVATTSSPTTQEFSSKNGFEEEEKEEKGGEEKMESFVHKSKGFIPMNLPNPK